MYASQSTPMMTAAGMLYYQALFFSHFHCMILAPLNQRLQNHFGRWSDFTFHPLGDITDEFSIPVALKRKTTTYGLSKLHQPVACKLDESMDESRGGREWARSQSRPSGYGTGTQQKANADRCVCPHSNKQAVETLWWIMKLPCFDNVVLKPKSHGPSSIFCYGGFNILFSACTCSRISKGIRLIKLSSLWLFLLTTYSIVQ